MPRFNVAEALPTLARCQPRCIVPETAVLGSVRSVVAALLFSIALAPVALAHPGHSVPVEELTRMSGTVLEGTVTSVASEWNGDRTQIYTTVDLRTEAIHKGAAARTVRLVLLGGTVGDITLAVLGRPTFEPGERVFLFLGPHWEQSSAPVVAGEHGKFTATRDTATGRDLLLNEGATLQKADAVSTVRLTTAAKPSTDR